MLGSTGQPHHVTKCCENNIKIYYYQILNEIVADLAKLTVDTHLGKQAWTDNGLFEVAWGDQLTCHQADTI